MLTQENLHQLVKEKLADNLFISVSNREPFIHTYSGRDIKCSVPASGLTTALDPVMQACGGVWVAHGSGNADREVVDQYNKVNVPPGNPRYSLKRVWLTKEEESGYYYGFANEALWPLCHIAYTRPLFYEPDWNTYRRVNEIFARSVLEEAAGKKAYVFIRDYHLALLPRLIKESNPDIVTAQFWHIPWPNPEAFRICPWQDDILNGLLGNDLLGFHIRYHCNNFMDTVDRAIEARVDRELYEITFGGKKTAVRPFPISVDFDDIDSQSGSHEVKQEIGNIKRRFGIDDEIVGIGLDRIDYTKGIPERFKALDRFFAKYPGYLGKLVFLQAGVPSRTEVGAYQHLNEEIDNLVDEINSRYGTGNWRPIVYLREHLSPQALMAFRRMAQFCVVSSVHDGMNLVAKEFVASRSDEDGVLILSPFTGAARELSDALLVNPYATDHFADAIMTAVEMPADEKQRRMRKMRSLVKENNIYKWAADIITALVQLEAGG